MIELELHKDWYFFVLENYDVTWKPRILYIAAFFFSRMVVIGGKYYICEL